MKALDNSPAFQTRLLRPGDVEPLDRSWLDTGRAERLDGVWFLTRLGYAWQGKDLDAERLQRSVVRVLRLPG
jgi:hypothetical protein